MLAALRDYLFPWQIPVGLLFVAAWVYGGGLFLRFGVRKHMPPSYKTQIGYCSLVSALAGCAGAVAALIIFVTTTTLGTFFNASPVYLAGFLAGLAMLSMSYIVVHSMFSLQFKQSLIFWAITLSIVVGAGAVLLIPSALITRKIGIEKKLNFYCQNKLQVIYAALKAYEENYGDPPESLSLLYERKPPLAPASLVDCPGGKVKGYFYLKPRTFRNIPAPTKRMLACDFGTNHRDGTRNVLFLDGTVRQERYTPEKFQELLNEPENAEFARMLKAAESGGK